MFKISSIAYANAPLFRPGLVIYILYPSGVVVRDLFFFSSLCPIVEGAEKPSPSFPSGDPDFMYELRALATDAVRKTMALQYYVMASPLNF